MKKGCLGFIVLFLLIGVVINFPILSIGLVVAGWGLYEWKINKDLGARSIKPGIIVSLGVLFVVVSAMTRTAEEVIEEQTYPSSVETDEDQKQETSEDQKSEKENHNNRETEQDKDEKSEKETEQESSQDKDESAEVTSVVDGDTIKVNMDGEEESVRLLLVDTPETNHPELPVQEYGPEATEFAEETLSGEEVELEYDGPKRDHYDRILAYIWIEDEMFNEMLLEEGLARYAYEYDPPYTHSDVLQAAEEKAKEQNKGVWSMDGYVTDEGFEMEDNTSSDESEPASSSSEENVYYENCDTVRAAGAAPVYEGDPGYDTHLDRDGDGVGCE
ncbi:thermonuclease family protein [Alteribacillus sp. JSM 102045]|uniref:thermonuclease family protein n=1 Tax=Alteribacillus sp. JSM 102045 TaxID=1562101 RepID=UPI0035C02DDE